MQIWPQIQMFKFPLQFAQISYRYNHSRANEMPLQFAQIHFKKNKRPMNISSFSFLKPGLHGPSRSTEIYLLQQILQNGTQIPCQYLAFEVSL